MSRTIFRFYFACTGEQSSCWKPWPARTARACPPAAILAGEQGDPAVAEVGILIVDDDVASQRALKNILDSEGWRVRIVPKASEALGELAAGGWNLAIVNVALADPGGPLFAILKELAQAPVEAGVPAEDGSDSPPQRRIRVLFLVPLLMAKEVQPVLEREGLPHSPKPYHLHEFLERSASCWSNPAPSPNRSAASAASLNARSAGGASASRAARARARCSPRARITR